MCLCPKLTPSPPPQAGALASFLKDLLMTDIPFAEPLQNDFARCMRIHFQVGAFFQGFS